MNVRRTIRPSDGRSLRAACAFIGLGFFLLGCLSDSENDTTPVSVEAGESGSIELVREYVAAMGDQDTAAAMESRCADSRVSAELMPQFDDELSRLLGDVGTVSVASAEVAEARTDAAAQGDNAVDVVVTLETPQGPDPAATLWTVVDQHGERCLAGWSSATDFNSVFSPEAHVVDLGQTQANVGEMVPQLADDSFSIIEDAAIDAGALDSGETTGWTRQWAEGDFGGARVDVTRYESADAAREATIDGMVAPLGDLVETFEIADIEGPIGLRYQASAWLWVQPLATGPFIDQTFVLAGDTVIHVAASSLSTRDGRSLVSELTRSATTQAVIG